MTKPNTLMTDEEFVEHLNVIERSWQHFVGWGWTQGFPSWHKTWQHPRFILTLKSKQRRK